MDNIKQLRDDLLQSFQELRARRLDPKEAKEITNMAGKIIMSSKVELDYNKYMDNNRVIDFLEVEKGTE